MMQKGRVLRYGLAKLTGPGTCPFGMLVSYKVKLHDNHRVLSCLNLFSCNTNFQFRKLVSPAGIFHIIFGLFTMSLIIMLKKFRISWEFSK